MSSLSVLEIKPLSEANTGKYIFLYGWFLFHFADVFFRHAEAFYLMKSHLFILSFMSLALGDILVKILLHRISEIFLPIFSFRTFMESQLTLKSFSHLEFIFVYGEVKFHYFACS